MKTFVIAVSMVGLVAPAGAAVASPLAAGTTARHVAIARWSTNAAWDRGRADGVRVHAGSLTLRRSIGTRVYRDPFAGHAPRRYDAARWTSPWVRPGFGLSQLIASWDATTPAGTWIEVVTRGRLADGRRSSWDVMGRWSSDDRRFHRTSAGAQADDFSSVDVDTAVLHGHLRYTSWQLQIRLLRESGSRRTPTVMSVGAMASALPPGKTVPTSPTTMRRTRDLAVPRFSQMIHRGQYPRWNGGGEAWCSPTSMAMVLAYWRAGPTRREDSWVNPAYRQPWVDYAARHTYDYGYQGAGNWPFTAAYAGERGLDAFVTRLRSLAEAERFIRAGIPLVASIAFDRGGLHGAPISSTPGHLLVIRGFTAGGNVIVNDPAAAHAPGVRRVYDRRQFENAWVGRSGGVVYVVHPAGVRLPPSPRPGERNW